MELINLRMLLLFVVYLFTCPATSVLFFMTFESERTSPELSHRRFIDETGLFILGDLENIVLTSFATDLA